MMKKILFLLGLTACIFTGNAQDSLPERPPVSENFKMFGFGISPHFQFRHQRYWKNWGFDAQINHQLKSSNEIPTNSVYANDTLYTARIERSENIFDFRLGVVRKFQIHPRVFANIGMSFVYGLYQDNQSSNVIVQTKDANGSYQEIYIQNPEWIRYERSFAVNGVGFNFGITYTFWKGLYLGIDWNPSIKRFQEIASTGSYYDEYKLLKDFNDKYDYFRFIATSPIFSIGLLLNKKDN